MEERRAWVRKAVNLPCWVLSDRNHPFVMGRVEDVSAYGAKLCIVAPTPDRFVLYLSTDRMIPIKCEVIWRTEGYIGVKFLDEIHVHIPKLLDASSPDLRGFIS